MQTWLVFSILVIVFWGVWGFVVKMAVRDLSVPSMFFISFVGYLSVIIYMFIAAKPLRGLNWPGVLWSLLAGVLTAWAVYFFYRAVETGKLGIVVPLTALYPIVTIVLSMVILKETFSATQIVGVGFAILAGILVSI